MPSKKVPTAKKGATSKSAAKKAAPAAKQAARKFAEPVAAATFRLKVDLANVAVGANTTPPSRSVVFPTD